MQVLKIPTKPVLVDIDALKFDEYNPRHISDEDVERLEASIDEHGLVLPLVVQRGTNMVVGGHQRLAVLLKMRASGKIGGDLKVWVVYFDGDDKQARRLNVALNRIGGEFDDHKLANVFRYLDVQEGEEVAMGFEWDEVTALLEATLPIDEVAEQLQGEASELNSFGRSITLSIEFDTVAQRDEAKGLLRALSKHKGTKAGDLLLTAMKAGKLGKLPASSEQD